MKCMFEYFFIVSPLPNCPRVLPFVELVHDFFFSKQVPLLCFTCLDIFVAERFVTFVLALLTEEPPFVAWKFFRLTAEVDSTKAAI